MKAQWSLVLFTLALTAGCQSGPGSADKPVAAATQKDNKAFSGFLGDYSRLQPAPDREGVSVFIDRSADYRQYTKVMFDPVQFYITPSADYPEVPRDTLKRIAEDLVDSFTQALAPEYQVVDTPGPDVLRLRTAITGIQPVKPSMGVTDLLPFKAAINVGREAAGAGRRVAEMAAEMEVLDPSGRRVAAATATRKGDQRLAQGEQVTWKDLQAINDYWAKGFRQRLDELRGVGRKG